jgi:hypothetical protein
MLKFNSKFNSQTGNFEIKCEFVGYTYAMFSDMLIGYLKAIPYTKLGKEKYAAYNAARLAAGGNEILDLTQLSVQISKINEGIPKIASESNSSKQLEDTKKGYDILEQIKSLLYNLGFEIESNNSSPKDDYHFILAKNSDLTTNQKNSINSYKENVEDNIKQFNDLNTGVILDAIKFKDITSTGLKKGFYEDITINSLTTTSTKSLLQQKIGSAEGVNTFTSNLTTYFDKNYTTLATKDSKFNIYDMNSLYDDILRVTNELSKKEKTAKQSLALELKKLFRETLGFDPTIRNMVETITVAIEIFIECVYNVSSSAEKNTDRKTQLEKKFGTNKYSSDLNKNDLANKDFYAWPAYRELDTDKKTYNDKYLGSVGVLDDPSKVDELVFIDDLLKAFIESEKLSDLSQQSLEAENNTWVPVNVLDTDLFSSTDPYSRYELINKYDIIRLMVIRAMTFMGVTNDDKLLTEDEIKTMVEIEIDSILRIVKDKTLLQSLSNTTENDILTISGKIDGKDRKVISDNGDTYVYNYIKDDNNKSVIPINKGFNDDWILSKISTPSYLIEKANNDYVFLTNYTNVFNVNYNKANDGSNYIKILNPSEYNNNKTLYSSDKIKSTDIVIKYDSLNLENVSNAASAGFNSFGGSLGIQEIKTIKTSVGDIPSINIFYSNKLYKGGGLAYTRTESAKKQGYKTNLFSKYDYKSSGNISFPNDTANCYKNNDTDNATILHTSLGTSNWVLFNEIPNQTVTYPYIQQSGGLAETSPNGNGANTSYRSSDNYDASSFSLFGSKWYYYQNYARINSKTKGIKNFDCSEYSKAMIFLNTLPFYQNGFGVDGDYVSDPDQLFELIHLFDIKGGFVHVPRLWCAYIGSIMWRIDTSPPEIENNKIISGGSGDNDPIVWKKSKTKNFEKPKRYQYFPTVFTNRTDYPNITKDDFILRLPQQIRSEFKRIFFEFVNSDGEGVTWESLKDSLEIWNGTAEDFATLVDTINGNFANSNNEISSSKLNSLKNKDKYSIISLDAFNDSLFLEIKDNSTSAQQMIAALTDEVIISNSNYKVWKYSPGIGVDSAGLNVKIKVDKKKFETYYKEFLTIIKSKADSFSPTAEKKAIEEELFGTTNEETIKLNLYTTCKNIHDKWLAGVTDENKIIFKCNNGIRLKGDSDLAVKYKNPTIRLIDSFRFVSRSFKDIGDKLYVNPIPLNDYLLGKSNSCAYDAISNLLDYNKFTFDVLPTFIDFRDENNVKSIFTPYPDYNEAVNNSCGPSFVCVYAGQTSKHLDFGNANYENDGFDFRCVTPPGSDKGGTLVEIPDDFSEDIGGGSEPVAVFSVKYGVQNQNIFKDINLDQSEFSETDESLQIQDEISQKGAENNRTLAGQNIYNVYSVRSYTAEIEMMGNAMIQPMMYFQLDNIPMFHGAYMITRVRHNIKPNFMGTTITGVRTRYAETPLVTSIDLYMSLAETIDTTSSGGGAVFPNSALPIVKTLIENNVSNAHIDFGKKYGQITTKKIAKSKYYSIGDSVDDYMITEAADSLEKMLNEWGKWMETNGYKKNGNGKYINIGSMYRNYSKQSNLAGSQKTAAKAGTSYHGWGLAVDMSWVNIKGEMLKFNYKKGSSAKDFDYTYNPAIEWLYNNSYRFGFINPSWARDGSGYDEAWHWEYHGKSAVFILQKNPKVYGKEIDLSKKYDSIVKNPKTIDGKEAVYTNGDYTQVQKGDGSDALDDQTILERGSVETSINETELFLKDVLKGLGIVNPNKYQVQFMKIWRQHEGGKAAWNPFNTTLNTNNSKPYNSPAGVKNYPNKNSGVSATVDTLKLQKYQSIVTEVKNITKEIDINKAIKAVNNSPWGSKIYPENYTSWKTFNNFIWKQPLVKK